MESRIPYLFVLSSGCQLYSGTGTALFDWIHFAQNVFEFALCIDNATPLNYRIARDFCAREGLRFLPSAPCPVEGAPDSGVALAQPLVASGRWPLVEILSWANAATNLDVVAARRAGTRIIYTPHTQPAWTIPDSGRYRLLESAFDRALAESDLICCDSPAEVATVRQRMPEARAVFLPLGVDTGRFHPAPAPAPRARAVLLVADFGEYRKRTDLSLAAIARLLARRPEFHATLVGRHSQEVALAPEIAPRVRRPGYVSDAELVRLYQQSAVFLLLSDYEAFGIPIVEALACGTPVVTTATREATSLFSGLPGCLLVDNTDAAAVDAALESALMSGKAGAPGMTGEAVAEAAARCFSLETTLRQKLAAIRRLGEEAGAPLLAAQA